MSADVLDLKVGDEALVVRWVSLDPQPVPFRVRIVAFKADSTGSTKVLFLEAVRVCLPSGTFHTYPVGQIAYLPPEDIEPATAPPLTDAEMAEVLASLLSDDMVVHVPDRDALVKTFTELFDKYDAQTVETALLDVISTLEGT